MKDLQLILLVFLVLFFQGCKEKQSNPPLVSFMHPAPDTLVLKGDTVVFEIIAEDLDGDLSVVRLYKDKQRVYSSPKPPFRYKHCTGEDKVGRVEFRAAAEDISSNISVAIRNIIIFMELASFDTIFAEEISINSVKVTFIISGKEGGTSPYSGICMSTQEHPDTTSIVFRNYLKNMYVTTSLGGLTPLTVYYLRAFAVNEAGLSYSSEISFMTPGNIPQVSTLPVSSVTTTSAVVGGNVTDEGGAPVTERGVFYGTSKDPEINGIKQIAGGGAGSFTVEISGLSSGTFYFVKAYATNIYGTRYGTELTFPTSGGEPTVITSQATSITATTAIVGGKIISNGNSQVVERGVCFSLSQNPETNGAERQAESDTGEFSIKISGLVPDTTYYAKAYAINTYGRAYGDQISFRTLIQPTISDVDFNKYKIVTIGTQTWFAENLKTQHLNDGTPIPEITEYTTWYNMSTPAFCWYDNDSATFNRYGALYNWFTISTGIICPVGWHVPSDDEWKTLIDFLGGEYEAGGKMKAIILWTYPNIGATDETGFTALPGGFRHATYYITEGFSSLGDYGRWWSATEIYVSYAFVRSIYHYDVLVSKLQIKKEVGNSIRCIKDN